ncbi:MAG: hypothetical protein J5848_05715 [Bacteroidales bacterium]|nr:hypothetical protein [Bacteroidales bacterium]
MSHGKEVCKNLKAIRRRIADENGIALEIPECTYEGECEGTCPRCDAELRYLENELSRRKSLGKVAVMAGVTMSLSSCITGKIGTKQPVPKPLQGEVMITCDSPDNTDSTRSEIPVIEIGAPAKKVSANGVEEEYLNATIGGVQTEIKTARSVDLPSEPIPLKAEITNPFSE